MRLRLRIPSTPGRAGTHEADGRRAAARGDARAPVPAPGGSPGTPVALSGLPPGASARLAGARLDAGTRDLLRALGLTDASVLRVCKPGDPFIIQVRETRLGLSRAVADAILVLHDQQPDGNAP